MTYPSSTIPRAAVRGAASGVIFMAIFGTLWAGIGIGGLQELGSPWLWISSICVGGLLLLGGVSLIWTSRQVGNQVTADDARHWRRAGIWLGVISTIEGMTIGVASAICSAIEHFNLLFPIMAIIVGVHFFPLSPLFRVKTHYTTGSLLCLLAIATLLFVPEHSTLRGQPIITWWTVVGFGSALILWGTGLVIWLLGKKMMKRSR